jgi:hypothetical protein
MTIDALFGFGKFYSLTNSFLDLQMESIRMMLLARDGRGRETLGLAITTSPPDRWNLT